MQTDAGTIHFNDVSRGVSGVLTNKSAYNGDDAGPPKVFPVLTERQIADAVKNQYANGNLYRADWSDEIGRNLR